VALNENASVDSVHCVHEHIKDICSNLADFLIEKNRCYGNSALQGMGIFHQPEDGIGASSIAVRLDDKLARIKNGGGC